MVVVAVAKSITIAISGCNSGYDSVRLCFWLCFRLRLLLQLRLWLWLRLRLRLGLHLLHTGITKFGFCDR